MLMPFKGVRRQWDLVNFIVFLSVADARLPLYLQSVRTFLAELSIHRAATAETPDPSPAQGEGETSTSSPADASSGSWVHP